MWKPGVTPAMRIGRYSGVLRGEIGGFSLFVRIGRKKIQGIFVRLLPSSPRKDGLTGRNSNDKTI